MVTKFAEKVREALSKRTPYTMFDGTEIVLKPLNRKDCEELNRWVQKQYMKNVSDACDGLDQAARMELQLLALDHAASLDFRIGNGQQILFSNTYGLSRYAYQMIDNPPMEFEEFENTLFPDGIVNKDGMKCLSDMIDIAYQNTPKPTEEDIKQQEELADWLVERMKENGLEVEEEETGEE